MYGVVHVSKKSIDDQAQYAGDEAVAKVRELAVPLQGARILHLSLSPFGTGVSELLHSLVPLMRDVGIDADWQVVHGNAEFAPTLRLMYEGLCGKGPDWTGEAADSWASYSRISATFFDGDYDAVIVHDPQLAGILGVLTDRGLRDRGGRWIWQCHMDLRLSLPEVWQTLLPSLEQYHAWMVQDSAFVPAAPPSVQVAVIPAAIDPANAANMDLSPASVRQFCANLGIDPARPLLVQVGPLDPAFDPVGAIHTYRRAKAERRDLQLLLAHPLAENSIEAWSRFEQVSRQANGDPHVHVLATQTEAGRLAVNTAQRAADVAIQRSVPAGFAPSVWEAQWKGKPVVVGSAGALASQVVEGRTGLVAGNDDAFVERVLELLARPEAAKEMGAAGHDAVRENHLITRLLADELTHLRRVLRRTSPA